MGIRNAFRRKGRSISTILQVAFAVAVVIAMLNGGDGFIDMTVRAYDPWTWDLRTTVADNPSDPMTADKAARIEGIEGVKSVELMTATGVHTFEVIGIDAAFTENGRFAYAPLEAVLAILQKGDGVNGFFIQTDNDEHDEIDATALRVSQELEDHG